MKKVEAYKCEICNELYYTAKEARACNSRLEFKESEYKEGMVFRIEDGNGDYLGMCGLLGVKRVDGHTGELNFWECGDMMGLEPEEDEVVGGEVIYGGVKPRENFSDSKKFVAADINDFARKELAYVCDVLVDRGLSMVTVMGRRFVHINKKEGGIFGLN